mmetsp:Transcript_9951/g.19436  ORF Transcript_9951/g.19436 Transcript_9951/m.19436 type:complete len:699 (+) Transcript_9951:190-2286(+)|eukprot:CAMPEP_0173402518 /NCGR_PEP_ID=MMETSP1356-20130122/54131_1 /TAXON_ID=77927 ORGANISM="Hemiselmis virescens, Strain PCC157" /NCGR_SAMPLE_ID=MMETSP1356 /ASSEMBLY_ACC=CAM_ASM_000847 /LENGTH=698 /DNA_ID=CAMNT_0014362865 /DNA_START=119 /DNA_END=2215 /DNA_ORIENTATION=-
MQAACRRLAPLARTAVAAGATRTLARAPPGRRWLHHDRYAGLQGFLGGDTDGEDGDYPGGAERPKWAIASKIDAMGPALVNLSRKVRHGLRQVDRVLDLFEPGQLGIAFNGGKDSTAVMHLVREACEAHPTHKFTHVQPIWFQHTGCEFPEVETFVQDTARQFFSYRDGLKTAGSEDLNRLWVIQSNTSEEFNEAMAQIAITTGIRALLISSRRTDPGCRDLSQMALMDLNPVFLSHTVVRIDHERKEEADRSRQVRGLPLGIGLDTTTASVNQPSILRFSPILEWSHRDVWDYILASEVPYCSLYDRGYTTIGITEDTIKNPQLERSNPAGLASVFAPPEGELYTLEKAIGAEMASPLTDAIEEMFKRVGVSIFGPTPFELRNEQAKEALHAQSKYYPAWMLKDENLEGLSNKTDVGDIESPFRAADVECTAAILVIGEEWISGAQHEQCSSFLCAKLRSAGVKVRQTLYVENDVDVIAFMIRRMHPLHKYLFVIGGLGASYGDVAMAAISKAFGTGVVLDPSLLRRVIAAAPPTGLTAYHVRLSYIPYACELIGSSTGEGGEVAAEQEGAKGWRAMMRHWPVIKKNNTYLFQSNVHALEHRFEECLTPHLSFPRFLKTTIHLKMRLAAASRTLTEVYDEFSPGVSIHQWIHTLDSGEDSAVVTLESKDDAQLKLAVERVLGAFPPESIVSVDWNDA